MPRPRGSAVALLAGMKTTLLPALLTLAACGAGLDTDLDELKRASATTSPTYALRTTDQLASSPTWKTSYTISSTGEVDFATDINGVMAGHHQLTVFINMPDGFSYQRIDVSFATDVVAAVGEQQAQKTSTGWRVWAAMPVAGTLIQSANLAGTWSAQTWVDSASAANASTSFTLQ